MGYWLPASSGRSPESQWNSTSVWSSPTARLAWTPRRRWSPPAGWTRGIRKEAAAIDGQLVRRYCSIRTRSYHAGLMLMIPPLPRTFSCLRSVSPGALVDVHRGGVSAVVTHNKGTDRRRRIRRKIRGLRRGRIVQGPISRWSAPAPGNRSNCPQSTSLLLVSDTLPNQVSVTA